MAGISLESVSAVIGTALGPPWPVDWSGVEQRLGVRLPADYKAFAEQYGPVLVGEWLTVLVPHDSASGGYFAMLDEYHGTQRSIRDDAPREHPHAFHPEADGLLAWGRTGRGEVLFWDTSRSDDPDDWPTRVWAKPDSYGRETTNVWRAFGMPTLKVIVSMVRGELALHPDVPRLALPGSSARLTGHIAPLTVDAPAPDRPSPAELRDAGRALAATVRSERAAEAEPPVGSVSLPTDYAELITRLGPGMLGGQLRLLAPGGPEGFDLDGEHARHADRLRSGWLDGGLDLPVLSQPPQRQERMLTAPGHPPASHPAQPAASRDTVAQLETIIGSGEAHGYAWDRIESELGVPLPTDYKRLLESRGPAYVNGIFLTNPARLVADHEIQAESLRDWWAERPASAGKVWPEPGGLLLCVTTEGREIVWWDTADPDPDRWTLTWDVEFSAHTFAGTVTELLIADLTGRLEAGLTSLTPNDDGPVTE
jgi:hypothetical protein